MSVDYSLLGGAESPYPPATPTSNKKQPVLHPTIRPTNQPPHKPDYNISFFNWPARSGTVPYSTYIDRGYENVNRKEDSTAKDKSFLNWPSQTGPSGGGKGWGSMKSMKGIDQKSEVITGEKKDSERDVGDDLEIPILLRHAQQQQRAYSEVSTLEEDEAPIYDNETASTTVSSTDELVDSSEMPKDPNDFLWMLTEEPHKSRRRAILKAHPEIRKLMGHTRSTFPLVILVVLIQILLSLSLRSTSPLSLRFILTSYILGATLNQNIFLSIHEITHNLAFKALLPNKLLAMVANIPIGVPFAMAFKGYHIEHHKYLGEDGIDTDLPSRLEAVLLNNVAGKTFFATFQILFYALRPGFIRSQKPTIYHFINIAFILFTDYLLVHLSGSYNPLIYLIMSSFLAGSLHPCAAHFIAEHYLMSEGVKETEEGVNKVGGMEVKVGGEELEGIRELSQETASYYGWMNLLCYNVGYHNEHHDFPSIPWTRLPKLHSIAHEFYDPLPHHPSWPAVTWRFITDPNVGMWSRAKRTSGNKGEKIPDETWDLCGEVKQNAAQKETETEVDAAERVEHEELEDMMDEAVERGYGSDVEDRKDR